MGLAPLLVRDIFRIVKYLNEQGTTILLVEQNAHGAGVAHRGYVLQTGRIILSDEAAALRENARFGPFTCEHEGSLPGARTGETSECNPPDRPDRAAQRPADYLRQPRAPAPMISSPSASGSGRLGAMTRRFIAAGEHSQQGHVTMVYEGADDALAHRREAHPVWTRQSRP